MIGQTKKQKEALELAIHIIEYEPDTLKSREWQNFFEDGYNNTNSLLIGLMEAINNRPGFYREVLEAKQYMPALLVSLAKYKAGESSILYLKYLSWYIRKLRQLNHSDEEIKQLLGINYKADLNKFLK